MGCADRRVSRTTKVLFRRPCARRFQSGSIPSEAPVSGDCRCRGQRLTVRRELPLSAPFCRRHSDLERVTSCVGARSHGARCVGRCAGDVLAFGDLVCCGWRLAVVESFRSRLRFVRLYLRGLGGFSDLRSAHPKGCGTPVSLCCLLPSFEVGFGAGWVEEAGFGEGWEWAGAALLFFLWFARVVFVGAGGDLLG